ncbi:MAG: universal stress protein [Armatimonadetes bacterium]|nr:universal stress protein [Armatimonadota bacterium]
MIKNILVGHSGGHGSEVAFRLAAQLAHATRARLRLAHVEPVAGPTNVPLTADLSADAYPATLPGTMAPLPEDPSEAPPVFAGIADACRDERLQCTFSHLYGDPAQRLSDLARLAGLVVLGRHDELARAGEAPLGRVARQLVTRMPAPLLLAGREMPESKALTLVYEPTSAGGRALALAGEIASAQNATLNAVALGHEHVEPAVAADEARLALRAYHVEGDVLPLPATGPEALQTAMLMWSEALVVLVAPPRRWLSRPVDSVRPALTMQNRSVLLVP